MIDRALPQLALALAAAASSRLRLEEHEQELRDVFVPAVAAMDDADRAYRRAIEETLPRESAGEVLSAMAAFRDRVHEVRDRTRREIAELYRRYNRTYGWFDPLDSFMPPPTGLSHADGTRVATIGDGARSEVDGLRAQVNEAVVKRLAPAQINGLIAAKRHRREAFEAALKPAVAAAVALDPTITPAETDKTLYHLTQLADGWY
jgi:hypothetical protein